MLVAREIFILQWNTIEWSLIQTKNYFPSVISHRCWCTCSHSYWACEHPVQRTRVKINSSWGFFQLCCLIENTFTPFWAAIQQHVRNITVFVKCQLEIITTLVTCLATKTLSRLYFVFTRWRLWAQFWSQWHCGKSGYTAVKPAELQPHKYDVR